MTKPIHAPRTQDSCRAPLCCYCDHPGKHPAADGGLVCGAHRGY